MFKHKADKLIDQYGNQYVYHRYYVWNLRVWSSIKLHYQAISHQVILVGDNNKQSIRKALWNGVLWLKETKE